MTKPPKPPATWLLVRPSARVGDELGYVALRRFIKCLGRQYGITLEDIRETAPQPAQTPLDASQHPKG